MHCDATPTKRADLVQWRGFSSGASMPPESGWWFSRIRRLAHVCSLHAQLARGPVDKQNRNPPPPGAPALHGVRPHHRQGATSPDCAEVPLRGHGANVATPDRRVSRAVFGTEGATREHALPQRLSLVRNDHARPGYPGAIAAQPVSHKTSARR